MRGRGPLSTLPDFVHGSREHFRPQRFSRRAIRLRFLVSTPWIPILMAQDPVLRGRAFGPCGSQAAGDDRGQLSRVTLSLPSHRLAPGPWGAAECLKGLGVRDLGHRSDGRFGKACLMGRGRWPDSLLQGPLSTWARVDLGDSALGPTPGEREGRGGLPTEGLPGQRGGGGL